MQVIVTRLAAAALLTAVAGCGTAATTTTVATPVPAGRSTPSGAAPTANPWRGVDKLPDARATFAAQPDDYRFKLRFACSDKDSRGSVSITVRDGQVSDVTAHPAHGTPRTAEAPTVEGLFAEIEAAAGSGAKVEVAFSPHGYPRKVAIDHDGGAAADDSCYHVHGLHFLTHAGR